MNWFYIVILFIAVLSTAQGIRKGLIRTIASTFFLGFAILLSVWLTPYVGEGLKQYTPLEQKIREKCETFLQERNVLQFEQIDQLFLPKELTEKMAEDSAIWSDQMPQTENGQENLAGVMTGMLLYLIAFLVAFAISYAVLQIVLRATDLVTKLPLIGFTNRLGGALVGIVRAVLIILVFFSVLPLFAHTTPGSFCIQEIEKDPWLSYLYTNNFLLEFVLKK